MCPAVCSVDVEDPRGLGVVKCGMGGGEGEHVTFYTLEFIQVIFRSDGYFSVHVIITFLYIQGTCLRGWD